MMFTKWFQKKATPEWQWYIEQFTPSKTRGRLIKDVPFYVIDVELTGLDAKTDRMLSICSVPVLQQNVLLSKSFDCHVQQTIYNSATAGIHEILPGENPNKLAEQTALKQLLQQVGTGVIVAHFANVERNFIQAALERHGHCSLLNSVVDTAALIGRVSEKYSDSSHCKKEDWQLEAVCRHFGVVLDDAHTACGDAVATALLFVKLVYLLEKRGVTTLEKLL